MDVSHQITNALQKANPGIYLLTGQDPNLSKLVQYLCNWLALRGPVRLVVGGNRFSTDGLGLQLHGRLGEIHSVVKRIYVSRAETSYQMRDALQKTRRIAEPLLVTDLLNSFYDEDLTTREVQNILDDCIGEIHRLSNLGPVIISAASSEERPALLARLWEHCDQVFEFGPSVESRPAIQQALF